MNPHFELADLIVIEDHINSWETIRCAAATTIRWVLVFRTWRSLTTNG